MNTEAIKLLEIQRKLAVDYMAEQSEACAAARQVCEAAEKEVDRMKARIDAIDKAIKKLS